MDQYSFTSFTSELDRLVGLCNVCDCNVVYPTFSNASKLDEASKFIFAREKNTLEEIAI